MKRALERAVLSSAHESHVQSLSLNTPGLPDVLGAPASSPASFMPSSSIADTPLSQPPPPAAAASPARGELDSKPSKSSLLFFFLPARVRLQRGVIVRRGRSGKERAGST